MISDVNNIQNRNILRLLSSDWCKETSGITFFLPQNKRTEMCVVLMFSLKVFLQVSNC